MKTTFISSLLLFFIIASAKGQNDYGYAKLHKEIKDGGYFTVKKTGSLDFLFLEEYTPSSGASLNYSVYDSHHNKLIQFSDDLPVSYGYNKYSIDLAAKNIETGNFYLLEVLNQKGEKWFLRFKVVQI